MPHPQHHHHGGTQVPAAQQPRGILSQESLVFDALLLSLGALDTLFRLLSLAKAVLDLSPPRAHVPTAVELAAAAATTQYCAAKVSFGILHGLQCLSRLYVTHCVFVRKHQSFNLVLAFSLRAIVRFLLSNLAIGTNGKCDAHCFRLSSGGKGPLASILSRANSRRHPHRYRPLSFARDAGLFQNRLARSQLQILQ